MREQCSQFNMRRGKYMKITRDCPLCHSGHAELLYRHKLVMTEKLSFMPSEYAIVCCKKCGNIYTSSEAGQATYDRYYRTLHAYTVDKNTQTLEEDDCIVEGREKMVSILKEYTNPSMQIVDVGSGTGGGLTVLQKHGYYNLLGIDVDDKMQLYKERQLKYRMGSVFDLPSIVSGTKNVYLLNGVLEHIYDVQKAIESLLACMNSDSILYIMVPDVERYVEYYDKPFRYFGIEHINHFSRDILGKYLIRNGFAILESGQTEGKYNQYYTEPEIYFVATKADASGNYEITYYTGAKEKTEEYIARSSQGYSLDTIESLCDEQTELAVWGVGSYLSGMLQNTRLSKCNISFFVDSNASLQGTLLNGIEIKSSEALKEFQGVIAITSAIYAESIRAEIKKMGLQNKTIVL